MVRHRDGLTIKRPLRPRSLRTVRLTRCALHRGTVPKRIASTMCDAHSSLLEALWTLGRTPGAVSQALQSDWAVIEAMQMLHLHDVASQKASWEAVVKVAGGIGDEVEVPERAQGMTRKPRVSPSDTRYGP